MLKKTITYTDYNDVERTEDFYFNISRAELIEMETSVTGGMQLLLEKLVAERDMPAIMEQFKKIIFLAYGEKSPDGKRFIKSKAATEAFAQTEAYSELLMDLMTGGEEALAGFINAIIPQGLGEPK